MSPGLGDFGEDATKGNTQDSFGLREFPDRVRLAAMSVLFQIALATALVDAPLRGPLYR